MSEVALDGREVAARVRAIFPAVGQECLLEVVQRADGDVARATAMLRLLPEGSLQFAGPDDELYIKTILGDLPVFDFVGGKHFAGLAAKGEGVVCWGSAMEFSRDIARSLCLVELSEASVRAFFDAAAGDRRSMHLPQFMRFFGCLLRCALLKVAKMRKTAERLEEERLAGRSRCSSKTRTPKASISAIPLLPAPFHRPGSSSTTAPFDVESRRLSIVSELPATPEPEETRETARQNEAVNWVAAPFPAPAPLLLEGTCVAQSPVEYRPCPVPSQGSFTPALVQPGGKVRVLERWLRTPDGWLPCSDDQGRELFEVNVPKELARALAPPEPLRGAQARDPRTLPPLQRSCSSAGRRPASAASPASKRTAKSLPVLVAGAGGLPEPTRNQMTPPRSAPMSDVLLPIKDTPGTRHACNGRPLRVPNGTSQPPGGPSPRQPSQGKYPGDPARLAAGEEGWQDRLDRLSERFPAAGPERILQVLRDKDGHAGKAARVLGGS